MSVLIKGLNLKPCKDGFDGKGLVIIGYDDKLYAVAHEQIIPLPDHGDLIDRDALMFDTEERYCTGCDSYRGLRCRACWVDDMHGELVDAPVVIPAERSEDG